MDVEHYRFAGYFIFLLFVAAGHRKAWPIAVVCALAVGFLYPDADLAGLVCFFCIPAVIYAVFTD